MKIYIEELHINNNYLDLAPNEDQSLILNHIVDFISWIIPKAQQMSIKSYVYSNTCISLWCQNYFSLLLDEKIHTKSHQQHNCFPQTCFDAKFSIWRDHHGSELARSFQVDHDYIPNLIIVLDLLWVGWVKNC